MFKALTWGLPASCALLVIGLFGTEKGRKAVRGVAKGAVKMVNKVTDEAKGALGHTQDLVSDILAEAKSELHDAKADAPAS